MKSILRKVRNIFIMISIPLTAYIIFWILCKANGVTGFGVGTDLTVIFRNTVYSGFIALAVSYNLTSGRFDFSVGATLLLSTILAGMLTLQFDLGPLAMLLLAMVFGALLGALNGFVYIVLRLPPMVVSLGIAMIYEAVGFIISGGSGVKLIGKDHLLIWAHKPYIYLLCFVVVAILYFVLNHTKFGYDTNSLRTGQEIAVSVGINEKVNTVICYVIAGICLASAGVINMSVLGTVTPKLSLGSVSFIQNAFMPMFIGGMLGMYFDRNTGVIIGALTQSIIFAGIGRLGVPSSWQAVVTGIIVLGFFGYSFNAYRIVEFRMFREKKARAEEKLQQHEGTA